MNRYSITNNGAMNDDATPKTQYIVITDLDTGKVLEDITGFYLEVDQPNGKVFLTLRKDTYLVKSNHEFATPNHQYNSHNRTLVGLYEI